MSCFGKFEPLKALGYSNLFSDTDNGNSSNGTSNSHKKMNRRQLMMEVKDMSHHYLRSFPPSSGSAPDKEVYVLTHELQKGEKISPATLDRLREALSYRHQQTNLASHHKDILGIQFPACDDFDVEAWANAIVIGAGRNISEGQSPKFKWYPKCLSMVYGADIFDRPKAKQGWEYPKPKKYLAAACVESGLCKEDLENAIAKMVAGELILFLYP